MPPTMLIDALQDLRRRIRLLGVLYGLGVVVAAGAGLLFATILLDYLLDLPPIPRLFVMALALSAAVYEVVKWIMRPMTQRMGLSDLAGKIERVFPAFDDRLRSSVDYLTKSTPGSEAMKQRVLSEAAVLTTQFDLRGAIETKPLWHSFTAAGGAILILAFLGLMLGQEYMGAAFTRLFLPFEDRPWPKRVLIETVGDLPQRVAAGQRINVRMHLVRGDRKWREAYLYYQYGDAQVEKQIMSRAPDGTYSANVDARADIGTTAAASMKLWMESGDDITAPRAISVVKRLVVTGVELTVAPPPYTQEGAWTTSLDTGPATVVYGSELGIKFTFNKDLDKSQRPTLEGSADHPQAPSITWDSPTGNFVVGHWMAQANSAFHIQAYDTDGLSNSDVTDYQMIVHYDQMPTVQLTKPARNEECTPQAVIPLRGIAEDDFAIKSLKLNAVLLGEKPTPFAPIELVRDGQPLDSVNWAKLESAGDTRRFQMDFAWDISKLGALKPGDVIEYSLEARDNFDLNGQTHNPVSSSHYRLAIMSQEDFASLMNDFAAQIRQNIVDIRNSQRALKDQTADLKRETQGQAEFSRADRAQAEQMIARQTMAASQAKQAAAKLQDLHDRMSENRSTAQDLQELLSSVGDALNQVAEHPMKESAGKLDEARNQKSDASDNDARKQAKTDARNGALDSGQTSQQDAAEKLDQMVSKMGQVGGLPEAIQKFKDLLAQQQEISRKSNEVGLRNLGKRPQDMSPEDAKAQQENASAQNSLADKTQKALDQMAKNAQKLQRSESATSQAMKQAAQTGQQQSVVSQMQNSAQQQQQNQQSAAQASQAKAEIGLQMIVRQLQEAQNRRLEELAQQLATAQQQIQQLIRMQSGLNYDNLNSRGGDVLKQAGAKLIGDLIDDAQWSSDKLPPVPDMDTQTRLQEQAQRNSHSVAKLVESLPDGAAMSASLERASDRMSRAITFLRDEESTDVQRWAGAYDPPQVEALTALHKAKELVDEQAAKNEEARQQQQKDTIREAYEKILTEQKKIDGDTKSVDASPRTEDGKLSHRETIRLAQLPGAQGDLADQINKIGDNLTNIGGIVYLWANQDIAQTMGAVKNELTQQQTGVETQAEQTRIEDQLQAMIDSLRIKPEKSQFTQHNNGGGGGGGGGGGSTLPPEAELHLLKQLQVAVNKSTHTMNEQGNPQTPVLVALGDRQGQLRSLMDQLLQKASRGKLKLGDEPSADEKLPEETSAEKSEEAELEHNLLHDAGESASDDQIAKVVENLGKRMGRSHQRLADSHDPGLVTQEIQKHILDNIDLLGQIARNQQSQSSTSQSKSSQSQTANRPQNQSPRPDNSNPNGQTAANNPALATAKGHDVDTHGTPTVDITQTNKEWGGLSPRARAAVIESASEKPVERFKSLIDQYYQALGAKAGQPQ